MNLTTFSISSVFGLVIVGSIACAEVIGGSLTASASALDGISDLPDAKASSFSAPFELDVLAIKERPSFFPKTRAELNQCRNLLLRNRSKLSTVTSRCSEALRLCGHERSQPVPSANQEGLSTDDLINEKQREHDYLSAQIYLLRAQCFLKKHKYYAAIADLNRLIAMHRKQSDQTGYRERALALKALGLFDRARADELAVSGLQLSDRPKTGLDS